MSPRPISRSPDLKRLRDEGYHVEIVSGYLLVRDVPYVASDRSVKQGILASELTLQGDIAVKPKDHTVWFVGDFPCDRNGNEINMKAGGRPQTIAPGLVAKWRFSSKPKVGYYANYHEKMTQYARIVSSHATSIDPEVTPQTFPLIEREETDSVFHYEDTASSRAGIVSVSGKLKGLKIGIIGLGGTGSYALDLVAKTHVAEIHLFDGDDFLQHNAFRAPGAASATELRNAPKKVAYYASIYSRLRRGIHPHPVRITTENFSCLARLDFVFCCIDGGGCKLDLFSWLLEHSIPFVDVGMGVQLLEGSAELVGILRVTTGTSQQHNHLPSRVSFESAVDGDDAYVQNIQIAELNALNAALAVLKWKKLFGVYQDLEKEHNSTYSTNVNLLTSEDYQVKETDDPQGEDNLASGEAA